MTPSGGGAIPALPLVWVIVVGCAACSSEARAEAPFGAASTTPDVGSHGDETPPAPSDDPEEPSPDDIDDDEDEGFKPVEWGPKGLDIRSRDGNYHAHIDWRAQLRLTQSNLGTDPLAPNPEIQEGQFTVNRARFKLGGHAYRPWLIYYLEYDFVTPAFLDLRFTLRAADGFQFRVGQWKVPYNRERVDSSGKQQFVERSIVNPFFTVDRQQGGLLFGRLWKGSRADSWYNVGAFSPTGRGGRGDVARPMLMGRWQWNFLKRDLPFSQSDFAYRKKPAASVSVAGATWRGPYTAFSTQGGGELPGFPVGGVDTYDVEQVMVETAFQGRGFSLQQEYHWKKVEDTVNGTTTRMEGGYLQMGYFFHGLLDWVPKPLELAVRVAQVDPDSARVDDLIREATVAANWFFAGHRNKLTLDLSWIEDEAEQPGERRETRLRVQWEVSF
jgi:phosphate-selective porin OprO/OprP